MEPTEPQLQPPKPASTKKRFLIIGAMLAVLLGAQWVLLAPPAEYREDTVVYIEKGWTTGQVAAHLKDRGVIRSEGLFKAIAALSGKQRELVAGYYVMDDRPSALEVLGRLVRGEYRLVPIKITVPEGATVREAGLIARKQLPTFDMEKFVSLSKGMEGYLFPDTYFFLPGTTEEEVVRAMRDNFDTRIAGLKEKVEASGRTLGEIVTMASILEEEANTPESRRVISGILWKRADVGMRLQVDAVFPYIMGKNTFELTLDDLRIDSPYNTYRYEGLPPGPISNPGLDSIVAALEPEESPYWFYLSDMEGDMHYAANFEQHIRNKKQYLD